jgi:hypothetical protein
MSSVFASPGTPTMSCCRRRTGQQDQLDHVALPDDPLLQLGDDRLASRVHPVGECYIICGFEFHGRSSSVSSWQSAVGSPGPGNDQTTK